MKKMKNRFLPLDILSSSVGTLLTELQITSFMFSECLWFKEWCVFEISFTMELDKEGPTLIERQQ